MNTSPPKITLKKKLKEYSLPVLLFTGLVLIITYYVYKLAFPNIFKDNETFIKELFSIGLTISGSGIFLAALKWFQFMDFFKNEIHRMFNDSEFDSKLEKTVYSIVYSEQFLKQRKDIISIWNKLNKVLFNNQFSDDLALQIQTKMHDLFIDNRDLSHFYRRFIYTMMINLDDEDFLTINIKTEAKIIRTDEKAFRYSLNYTSARIDENDVKSAVNFNKILIDSAEQDLTKSPSIIKDDLIIRKFETMLEGKKEYELRIDLTLVYNVKKDCEFQLFFERFIDYLRVSVHHSPNLKIHFLPFGREKFEEVSTTPTSFVRAYTPLIFPEKDFRLIFEKQ